MRLHQQAVLPLKVYPSWPGITAVDLNRGLYKPVAVVFVTCQADGNGCHNRTNIQLNRTLRSIKFRPE
jgi:hypothetical protein